MGKDSEKEEESNPGCCYDFLFMATQFFSNVGCCEE
jgi:hypothetical protein